MLTMIPCPNPECDNGEVYVFNAYSIDPLEPETECCRFCIGRGFVFSGEPVALAS